MSVLSDQIKTDSNKLLDFLIKKMKLKNDAQLSRKLSFHPPVISKIRHGRLPIGPVFLLRAHEASDLSVRDLKRLAGLPVKI